MVDLLRQRQPGRSKRERLIDASTGEGFLVRFTYDPIIVDVVKHGATLPKRLQWRGEESAWSLAETPLDVECIEALASKWDFTLTEAAQRKLEQVRRGGTLASGVALRDPERRLQAKLARPLRKFQEDGVRFIVEKKRVILADFVGAGKSGQSIVAVEELGAYPCVVVCPSIVKAHWKAEVERALAEPRQAVILSGRTPGPIPADAKFIILNRQILANWVGVLRQLKPRAVVLDEAHELKNPRTQCGRAARALVEGVPVRIAATGTPIVNADMLEIVALLRLIGRLDEMGGAERLYAKHAKFEASQSGIRAAGVRNAEDLHRLLKSTCLIRREKGEVAADMPPLTRTRLIVPLTNAGEYRHAEAAFLHWLASKVQRGEKSEASLQAALRGEALMRMGALRRLSGLGKVQAAVEWAREAVEDGESVVIFTMHRDAAQAVQAGLAGVGKGASLIMGDTSQRQRQAIVEGFGSTSSVLVATLDTAGTGLDGLQRVASNVLFVELPWTAAKLVQGEGRLNRMGQQYPVNACYLLGEGTVDVSTVWPKLELKESTARQVVDGAPEEAEGSEGGVFRATLQHFLARLPAPAAAEKAAAAAPA